MNELVVVFKQLAEQVNSRAYLKIASDDYGYIVDPNNRVLHRFVRGDHPSYFQAIDWHSPEEGVVVIRDCLTQIQTTPGDFSWL